MAESKRPRAAQEQRLGFLDKFLTIAFSEPDEVEANLEKRQVEIARRDFLQEIIGPELGSKNRALDNVALAETRAQSTNWVQTIGSEIQARVQLARSAFSQMIQKSVFGPETVDQGKRNAMKAGAAFATGAALAGCSIGSNTDELIVHATDAARGELSNRTEEEELGSIINFSQSEIALGTNIERNTGVDVELTTRASDANLTVDFSDNEFSVVVKGSSTVRTTVTQQEMLNLASTEPDFASSSLIEAINEAGFVDQLQQNSMPFQGQLSRRDVLRGGGRSI